jgi:hypothetical protein
MYMIQNVTLFSLSETELLSWSWKHCQHCFPRNGCVEYVYCHCDLLKFQRFLMLVSQQYELGDQKWSILFTLAAIITKVSPTKHTSFHIYILICFPLGKLHKFPLFHREQAIGYDSYVRKQVNW